MQDIRNEIKNITEIVPIPSTVTLILSQSLRGDMASEKLIRLIDADAVLTALLLRAANSAFYGLRSGVATVEHAVMLLGITEVSRLVLMYDMKQRVFSLNKDQRDYLNRLWLHSVASATAARILAKRIGLSSSGEEFTCALLHDMGKIVIAQHFVHGLMKSQQMVDEMMVSDTEAETQIFAVAHDEVGAIMAENWGLPQVIIDVMRYHHNVHLSSTHHTITCVVRMADVFAETWGLGIGERSDEMHPAEEQAWASLKEEFPALAELPFETFEEELRMEFENNQAFSELFS